MPSACFVTNELYPLKPGGIGRLMYNFAVHNQRSPGAVDLHYLLPSTPEDEQSAILASFEGLGTVHFCAPDLAALGEFGALLDGLPGPSGLDEHVVTSMRYYAGLLKAEAEAGGPFDIIEFPDFGGWAWAAISAKRAGFAFLETTIAIRLHSSFGLIAAAEPYYHRPSLWMAAICDMERQALEQADLVVAHLDCIADVNARMYRFGEEWRSRVVTEFPPILLDQGWEALGPRPRGRADFVFSTRLQPFKRPDSFVRAAVKFLRNDPESSARFLVASYGWDEAYVAWLKSLVPSDLLQRVGFPTGLSPGVRGRLLHQAIVVVPSVFESLCLFAYESSQLGAKVILNRRCEAFGKGPRWREGDNCLMYDGSHTDLAKVMRQALDWEPASKADVTPDVLYWQEPVRHCAGSAGRKAPARLDVLVFGVRSLSELDSLLLAAAHRLTRFCHVLVPRPLLPVPGLPLETPEVSGIRLHLSDWLEPTPSEILDVIGSMEGDAVAFSPAGMMIDPAFLTAAAEALARDPLLQGVTCHSFEAAEDAARPPQGVRLFAGGLPTVAAATTRVGHRASVVRREALVRLGLREEARERWFEDLLARLVDAGGSMLCLPAALVTEPAARPATAITDEIYHATRRDELGFAAGTAGRLGSVTATQTGDFVPLEMSVGQDPDPEPPELAAWPIANFASAEISKQTGDGGSRYRDISVGVGGLQVGRRHWDRIYFKLGMFLNAPQIEFREQAHMIFESWPPPTSDQWGPILEYAPSAQEEKARLSREAMLRLTAADRRRLGALLEALPFIIMAAKTDLDLARADWVAAAEALQAQWLLEGW